MKFGLLRAEYPLSEIAISQDGGGRSIACDYSDLYEIVLPYISVYPGGVSVRLSSFRLHPALLCLSEEPGPYRDLRFHNWPGSLWHLGYAVRGTARTCLTPILPDIVGGACEIDGHMCCFFLRVSEGTPVQSAPTKKKNEDDMEMPLSDREMILTERVFNWSAHQKREFWWP